MASRVVRQPNGLYARWSDVVDDFTDTNLTRDEMVKLYQTFHGMSREDATAKVERADANSERLAEELRTVRWRHGHKGVKQRLRAMGVDPRKWRRAAKA